MKSYKITYTRSRGSEDQSPKTVIIIASHPAYAVRQFVDKYCPKTYDNILINKVEEVRATNIVSAYEYTKW